MKIIPILPRSRVKALTLLELCVAVFILTVLAALLLPLLAGARERSKAVSCTQKLRQIGSMLHGVIGERNGQLTIFRDGNIEGNLRWYNQLRAYSGLTALDAKKAFGCPSLKAEDVTDWFCYGLRAHGTPGKRTSVADASQKKAGLYVLHTAMVEEPGKFLMMADTIGTNERQTFRIVPPKIFENTGIQVRHSGRANVLFLDGHIEALDAAGLARVGISEVYDQGMSVVRTSLP